MAVKILRPELAGDAEAVRAFLAEARATGAVIHEGVVRVLGHGSEDGVYFILMELVDGPPLDRLLERQKRLPWQVAARESRRRSPKPSPTPTRRDGSTAT